MKTVRFDIKYRDQIRDGKYNVVTMCGDPVKIVCWDAEGKYKLVGYVKEETTACFFTENGKCPVDSSCDLELIPALSEFEQRVLTASHLDFSMDDYEAIRNEAEHLKKLAKEEIFRELPPSSIAELEAEVRSFCDIQEKHGMSSSGIKNWTSLFLTIARKIIEKEHLECE